MRRTSRSLAFFILVSSRFTKKDEIFRQLITGIGRKQVPSILDDDTEECSDDETDDEGSSTSDPSEYIYLC